METDRAEMLKAAREFQVSEMNYRRTHRWNIFAWAAGLLLGGSSIIFTFKPRTTPSFSLQLSLEKEGLIIAVVGLVLISVLWVLYHYHKEKQAEDIINTLDEETNLNLYRDSGAKNTKLKTHLVIPLGSVVALLFLAALAILIVLSTT